VPIESDGSLSIGHAFHSALESLYKLDMAGKPRDAAAIASIIKEIDNHFSDRFFDLEQKRRWHLVGAMFKAYVRHYPRENFNVVAIEREFSGPIINPATGCRSRSFQMAGKVDGVIQDKSTGEYFLLEHKSASAISGDYLERLPLDKQIHLYCHYISQELNIPISGVIYNVVQKAMLRQNQGETKEQYQARRAELIAKSKTGKTSAKRKIPESDKDFQKRLMAKYEDGQLFHREILFISPDDIEATLSDLWQVTQRLLSARRDDLWYRNTDFCFRYNKPCIYFPLCRSNGSKNVIANLFQHRAAHSELTSTATVSTETIF